MRQQSLGGQPASTMCSRAGACRIAVGSLNAYFGRIVTTSRKRARTTSSRKLSSSPILTRSLSSKPGGMAGSTTSSTRSRCEGKRDLAGEAQCGLAPVLAAGRRSLPARSLLPRTRSSAARPRQTRAFPISCQSAHGEASSGSTSAARSRASDEIFTPGASDVATARSLKASEHRRRSATGSARTSTNWFGLVLRIGVDIDVDIPVRPLSPARPAPPERSLLGAYAPSQAMQPFAQYGLPRPPTPRDSVRYEAAAP